MSPAGDLAVVIAARNESDLIRATVTAAARIGGVDLIVVADDASVDGTASAAAAAGAIVVRHARHRGKGAAMETGAEAVSVIEAERAAACTRSCTAPASLPGSRGRLPPGGGSWRVRDRGGLGAGGRPAGAP